MIKSFLFVRTHFSSATAALRVNQARSLLTIGGLAVGVSALMGLFGIGEGFTASVSQEMAALGTHLLLIEPHAPTEDRRAGQRPPGTLSAADTQVIAAIPGLAHAVAVIQGRQVALGSAGNSNIALVGATPGYASALHLQATEGRLLDENDEAAATKSIVLGARLARFLLGSQAGARIAGGNAEITLGHARFSVVGVLQPVGNFAGWDIDDAGFVPFSTAKLRIFGVDRWSPMRIDALLIDLANPAAKIQLVAEVQSAMREQHRIAAGGSNDFGVVDTAASARTESSILRMIQLFLLVMAASTILVGGVGVTNVMLVAVAERKNEIGLLQALGARRCDIQVQFLIEALLLTLSGSLTGIVLGIGAGHLVALATGIGFHIGVGLAIIVAVGASAVGVLAGLLPALRASRHSPLAALHGPP